SSCCSDLPTNTTFFPSRSISKCFVRAVPAATGRPGYDPRDLLKFYVYGYLNEVRSSRKLERECGRNVELMWLLRRLAPDFKTIADFRRDNGPGIVGTPGIRGVLPRAGVVRYPTGRARRLEVPCRREREADYGRAGHRRRGCADRSADRRLPWPTWTPLTRLKLMMPRRSARRRRWWSSRRGGPN